jgi:lipopolysaccharide export system protein LptC
VLNLSSWVISAEMPVSIQRSDLELTGQTMVFNTKTKQGRLGGGVRMLIFELDTSEDEKPDAP